MKNPSGANSGLADLFIFDGCVLKLPDNLVFAAVLYFT
jgi:hypothetical protein